MQMHVPQIGLISSVFSCKFVCRLRLSLRSPYTYFEIMPLGYRQNLGQKLDGTKELLLMMSIISVIPSRTLCFVSR